MVRTPPKKTKNSSKEGKRHDSPSQLIDARIQELGDWRGEMLRLLAKNQRDDGGFVNTKSHLMKEDDPLLCTALAVIALTNAVRD